MHAVHDRTIRLRDGRTLGYAEYGAPDGLPVVYAHGGLSCRLDIAAGASTAQQTGIRLISVDRPGIGLSDPKPGRSVADWSDDITELRDQLGFDAFGAMGWSMGGQYALALGHGLRSSVTRVAVIAGGLPLTEPGHFAQMPPVDRTFIRLSQRAPWLARQCLGFMGITARLTPRLFTRLAAGDLPPADGAVVRTERSPTFAQTSAEALQHPEGHIEDYLAAMQPWGFTPEEITVPVDIWGGADDHFLDPSWPTELARRIPDATLTTRPGGHFMAHLHWREIFDALTR